MKMLQSNFFLNGLQQKCGNVKLKLKIAAKNKNAPIPQGVLSIIYILFSFF